MAAQMKGSGVGLRAILMVALVGIAIYQVYSGVFLKKVGVPGIFTLEFETGGERKFKPGGRESAPPAGAPADSASSASKQDQAPMPTPPEARRAPGATQRTFTTRTVRELMSLYEGRTMLQADALMEPYKGLWISVKAEAVQIIPDTAGATVVLQSGQDLVNARFDNFWRKALGRVNSGDTIAIRGRIGEVQNGQQLYLVECDIGG